MVMTILMQNDKQIGEITGDGETIIYDEPIRPVTTIDLGAVEAEADRPVVSDSGPYVVVEPPPLAGAIFVRDDAECETQRQCKICMEHKPLEAFYLCGNKRQHQCKDCRRLDRQTQAMWPRLQALHMTAWPNDMVAAAQRWSRYRAQGGRLDYKGCVGQQMADLWDTVGKTLFVDQDLSAPDLQEEQTLREELLQCRKDIEVLRSRLQEAYATIDSICVEQGNINAHLRRSTDVMNKLIAAVNTNTKASALLRFSAKDIQERKNALEKLRNDQIIRKIFEDDELEHAEYIAKLQEVSKFYQSHGYIKAEHLRALIMPFMFAETAMPDNLLVFCYKFIVPGCAGAQEREDYLQETSKLTDWLMPNYFEIPWSNIPLEEC